MAKPSFTFPCEAVLHQCHGHPDVALRKDPSDSGRIVHWVPNGTKVKVLAEESTRVHVQVIDDPKEMGWAKRENLQLFRALQRQSSVTSAASVDTKDPERMGLRSPVLSSNAMAILQGPPTSSLAPPAFGAGRPSAGDPPKPSVQSVPAPSPMPSHSPAWLQQALPGRVAGKISDTSLRGISLKQLLELSDLIQRALGQHEIVDQNERSPTKGQRIRWEILTMYHVCEHFILPLTQAAACSYVELVSSTEQAPQWMVSHAWSTLFMCTVSMLTFHAKSRCQKNPLATFYWCCTLANNQHDLAELQEEDIMQSPFARVLTSQGCIGTVLLCDTGVTPLKRVWCVFEVYITGRLRDKSLGSKGVHFLDVMAFVVRGREEPAGGSVAVILQDATAGNWHEVTEVPGVYFPLEVACAGTEVDIAKSEASVDADRNAILNHIAHSRAERTEPPVAHAQYDSLNEAIHRIFASAELYRLACARPDGCVEAMDRLLKMQADPNNFVRNGNTALFALVGADPMSRERTATESLEPMLALLLGARADPNSVNSQMLTVLDTAGALPSTERSLLRAHGARAHREVVSGLEKSTNSELHKVVLKGFSMERGAFGGTGGGGSGAKLLQRAEQCMLEVATMLKRYPSVPCHIITRVTKQDRFLARGRALKSALESAGCSNPIDLHSVDHGPLVRVTLSFTSDSTR